MLNLQPSQHRIEQSHRNQDKLITYITSIWSKLLSYR